MTARNPNKPPGKAGRKPGRYGVVRSMYLDATASEALDHLAIVCNTSCSKVLSSIILDVYMTAIDLPVEAEIITAEVNLVRNRRKKLKYEFQSFTDKPLDNVAFR